MSDNTLTLHGDGSATLSTDRLSACLSAAWELEALAQVLPGLCPTWPNQARPISLSVALLTAYAA